MNTVENKNCALKFQMNPARAINPGYQAGCQGLNTTKGILREFVGFIGEEPCSTLGKPDVISRKARPNHSLKLLQSEFCSTKCPQLIAKCSLDPSTPKGAQLSTLTPKSPFASSQDLQGERSPWQWRCSRSKDSVAAFSSSIFLRNVGDRSIN